MRAPSVSGIYLITCNRPTGLPLYYVGQSIDTRKRLLAHQACLRAGRHHNNRLQMAWNKYGSARFVFGLIGRCAVDDLDREELWFITEMQGRPSCCNIGTDPSAPNRGRRFGADHRGRIAAAHTGANHYSFGKPLAEAHRAKISAGGKGVKRSKATREKISSANKGNLNSMAGKTGLMHPRSRAVTGTCLVSGKQIRFDSGNLAMVEGFDQGAIHRCCNGVSKSHKGYAWAFTSASA